MRFILAAIFALMLTTAPTPGAAQNAEIEGVISGQLDAFQRDDFAEAFDFASPMIKRIFRTPDRFGMMVQRGYPMVWRPGAVRFLDLRDAGSVKVQIVEITDQAGTVYNVEYQMIEGPSGWMINGVQVLKAPGVAA